MNKPNAVIRTSHPGKYNDSSDRPQGNHSNIIPFPTQPVPGKQPATGARHLDQLIRHCLHRVREHVLSHIRITNKSADGQSNGKCSESARASKRAMG